MRRSDELARFWNDTRSRLAHGAWSRAVWIGPLVAAATGALFILIGSGSAEHPAEANAGAATAIAASPGCEDQTWPFFSDACLRGSQANPVRVLQHEPALAAAAIGATPWAPRAEPRSSRQPPSRHKQAAHDRDRTATVRSGRRERNATRERSYAVPADAFSAYGSARR